MNSKNFNTWPKIKKEDLELQRRNIVVQINGKTRDVLKLDGSISEKRVLEASTKNSKAKKFLEGRLIIKHIYIENKLINIVLK